MLREMLEQKEAPRGLVQPSRLARQLKVGRVVTRGPVQATSCASASISAEVAWLWPLVASGLPLKASQQEWTTHARQRAHEPNPVRLATRCDGTGAASRQPLRNSLLYVALRCFTLLLVGKETYRI